MSERYQTFLVCEDISAELVQALPLTNALTQIGNLRPFFWAQDLIDVEGLSDGDQVSTSVTDWWNANTQSYNPVDSSIYRFSKPGGVNSPTLVESQSEIGNKPAVNFVAASTQALFEDTTDLANRDKYNFMHEGDSTFWMLCRSDLSSTRHPLGWSGFSGSSGNGPSWGFRFDGQDVHSRLTADNTPFNRAIVNSSGDNPYTLGEWVLIINTWDNTAAEGNIYFGSTLIKNNAYADVPDTGRSTYASPTMGRHPTSASWWFDGQIACWAMHAKIFTPSNILTLVNSINLEYSLTIV